MEKETDSNGVNIDNTNVSLQEEIWWRKKHIPMEWILTTLMLLHKKRFYMGHGEISLISTSRKAYEGTPKR